jgi:NAD(P)-dependent dehydrogenase (short-subunit alcohol dehydrogenase family)
MTESESDDRALLDSPPDLRLDGRVAWVTGASRGLGRSLAYALAGAGANVVLTARSEARLADLAGQLRQRGCEVEIVAGSVAEPAFAERAADTIRERWGRLDALVNNAGISPSFAPAERVQDADWRAVLETNLFGAFACCRAAVPLLEASGAASVVNVSSVHGSRAHERLVSYAASKGGLEMLTRTLAVEWAPRGIRVNAVAPGYLETDMTTGLLDHPRWGEALRARIPLSRFARTAEVVPAVMFLAGPASSYITGTTLFVDGGWSAT